MSNNHKLPLKAEWPDEDLADWPAAWRTLIRWQARAIKAACARGRNNGRSVYPCHFESREEWQAFRALECHALEVMQEAAKRRFYPREHAAPRSPIDFQAGWR